MGKPRTFCMCQQSQVQVTAGEMASVMNLSVSLEAWYVKEEEEQKILLSSRKYFLSKKTA